MSYHIKNVFNNLTLLSFAAGVLDTDLSSVSGADDTIPSAKATKTALDLKVTLAGLSGGQTIEGGTGSGENLTLSSTHHGTKGNIILGTSYYDQVNNRLVLGVSVPLAVLHLKAGTATAGTAPLKLTTGTLLGAVEDGALEYDGAHLYFTIGAARTQII